MKKIEKKWQKYWEEHNTFKVENKSDKEKYYILVEFPYPSGSGLHVGHVRSYTALDAMARLKRMQGYNVLFPMGWDAFGAPAEKYAIDNHIHPANAVKQCIKVFKGQMEDLGFSFDWSREFATTDPKYYKWTQWQFLKFFEKDMAYKAKKDVNWCENCKTVLSNEDSAGGVCERCGNTVVKKEKEQWMLKMKSYAESLLDGLKDTQFLDRIKTAQINWINKSVGAEVNFKINNEDDFLTVFTTRSDTLYGVTFMVMSPEHSYIEKYKDKIKNLDEVKAYQKAAKEKSEIERTDVSKEKTGVKLDGFEVVNPISGETVEVWISDYVLSNYGTGAIMAVPAHDDRDYAFAKKFNIKVKQVIMPVIKSVGDNEPRLDKENTKRNCIMLVIEHWDENKYLYIKYKKFDWNTLVQGGIEEGEDPVESARRECIEETGYFDIKTIQKLPFNMDNVFYAAHKGVNRYAHIETFYIKLASSKKNDLDEYELAEHDVLWGNKNELISKFGAQFNHHVWVLNQITSNKCDLENSVLTDTTNLKESRVYINSEILNGITSKEEAIEKTNKFLEDNNIGKQAISYKLEDWIFSRQRFWGEPIPIITCNTCGHVAVPEKDLPVTLPENVSYEPTEDGESPLANMTKWLNVPCPKCGKMAKRETDTMPNWAGSSWYWLRYMDPKNNAEFASMDAMKYWGQVDYYNGGMEHAARHLLYARFWNQFLYDEGLVAYREPFLKRVAHGMILGENNEKMSKSRGNVVNPDDMVNVYGADALRVYEMFIGDYEKDAVWSENGLKGCKRFLDRVASLKDKMIPGEEYGEKLIGVIHKTIKKVTEDILTMNYNTAVSALMILSNAYGDEETITKKDYNVLLSLLNPIAPHITEELNEEIGNTPICESIWPVYDEKYLEENTKTIGVQFNGKLIGSINLNLNATEDEAMIAAKEDEKISNYLNIIVINKVIYIPGRILNIVGKK